MNSKDKFNRVDEEFQASEINNKNSTIIELEKVIDKISLTNEKKNLVDRKGKQQSNQNNNNHNFTNNARLPIYIPPPLLTLRKSSVVVTLSPTGCTPIISSPPTTPLSPNSIPFTLNPTSLSSSIPLSHSIKPIPTPIPKRTPISMKIRYLPPLELKVILGEGYPSTEPPRFSLRNSSSTSKEEVGRAEEMEKDEVREAGWLSDSNITILEGILNECELI